MTVPLRAVVGPSAKDGSAHPLVSDPSFEAFFRAERARLFGALVVKTGNRAEAEEILQDAFLTVWERWERVAAMEEPVGFIYRTAMNLFRSACDVPRSLSGRPCTSSRERTSWPRWRCATKPSVCSSGSRRERAAIVVTAYLGYSSEEVGDLLGIQATTVRVLTNRARASLRGVKGVSE